MLQRVEPTASSATQNPRDEDRLPGRNPEPTARVREMAVRGMEGLRIALGVIWTLDLLFILYPPNDFFGSFSSTASSFAVTTPGGTRLADFVAAHPAVFAWLIALVTAYLALAFLLGLTTRLACYVGATFNAVLLLTQLGMTFVVPGGTDVGPQPLYLAIYLVLFVGGAGRYLSLDRHLWATRWSRFPRLLRTVASPPPD